MQIIKVTALRGTYILTGHPQLAAKSSMETNSYWDTINRKNSNYNDRFYSLDPAAVFGAADPMKANGNIGPITSSDSPDGGPLTTFKGQQLNGMTLVWDFDLYVAAATKDTRNQANVAYGTAATVHWQFNGTGGVTTTAPYMWTPMGAGITAPVGGWQATDVSLNLDTTRANDALLSQNYVAV